MRIKKICVYCGSSPGTKPEYTSEAKRLGELLSAKQIELIYGGSILGLMGTIANAVLASGGKVTGIMPRFLIKKEIVHTNLTRLIQVETMHERKTQMADLADAFVALPGGWGTMEEFFEVLTWGQLGLHSKPCGLLNICNYFDFLTAFLDHSVSERFLSKDNRNMIILNHDPVMLLDELESYQPPKSEKWLDRKLE